MAQHIAALVTSKQAHRSGAAAGGGTDGHAERQQYTKEAKTSSCADIDQHSGLRRRPSSCPAYHVAKEKEEEHRESIPMTSLPALKGEAAARCPLDHECM